MRSNRILSFLTLALVFTAFSAVAFGQKAKPAARPARPIIFAVLGDGKTLEPIAYVRKGKPETPVDGGAAANIIRAFNQTYYKVGAKYRLIFGGADAGTVTVKGSNAESECGKNIGEATTVSTKTPLKGLVMGLATNVAAKPGTFFRRKPTAAEKDEMDALAKAEFIRQKLTPKVLRYQNLTALDVDSDGKPEFVASYWVEIDKLTRGLLFFIATKGTGGKYTLAYKEYRSVDQGTMMSGAEISSIDEGVYHELLLDSFDIDGDGTREIFTYQQSFEGSGFHIYRRGSGGKWTRLFEGSNYHCGF